MKVALVGCGKAGSDLLEELIQNASVSAIDIYDPRAIELENLNFLSPKVNLLSKIGRAHV